MLPISLQELMGRPLRLKFSEKRVKEDSRSEKDEDQGSDSPLQES